jgi:thiol:disulfide interchange protein DsbC
MSSIRRLSGVVQAIALAAGLALVGPASHAQAPAADGSAAVKAAIESWLKGRYKVDEVRRTPMPGIWEVRLGNDLLYVDEKGQYAFVEGAMVELKSGRNLTRERTDEMLAINFKDLPLNLAIKQVIGNGKRVVAVFEDANCGYCRTMRKDLLALKDVTIYTFPVAILAADSETKARKALCAADKVAAWNDLMTVGKVPGNAGTCDTPLAKVKELSQKLSISATPTVFFGNGKRLQGYVPGERFERMLEENSRS